MSEDRRAQKYAFWERMWNLLENHEQVLVISVDNVTSLLLSDLRHKLRGKAEILMGKNTLLRAGLRHRMNKPKESDEDYEKRKDNWYELDRIQALIDQAKLNVGFVFCRAPVTEVAKVIKDNRVEAPARAGLIAPNDVWIPAGGTGLDPSQTSFFQAIGISTKIVKGFVEIISDERIVEEGKKVQPNEAALLQKLNIKPFTYGAEIVNVYDSGEIFDPKVLDISDEQIIGLLQRGSSNIAAISLEIGYPTSVSAPHSILGVFKNLAAICLQSDLSFKQAETYLEMAKDPSKFVAVASSSAPAAKQDAKVEEEKEEEVGDMDLGGGALFGGDDDDW